MRHKKTGTFGFRLFPFVNRDFDHVALLCKAELQTIEPLFITKYGEKAKGIFRCLVVSLTG